MKTSKKAITEEQVNLYRTVKPLLISAYDEIKEFSKKKQDELLNLTKVKIINRLLEDAQKVLKDESTHGYLELLDENQLPSNSDAVLIMSQYISALNKFQIDHYKSDSELDAWNNSGHWE